MNLVDRFRRWWFNNEPGPFEDWTAAERWRVQVFGGPSRVFETHPHWQKVEWLSRLEGRDLAGNFYDPHLAGPLCKYGRRLCRKQGDEHWTHYYQDHWFAASIDPELDAPKCALFLGDGEHGKLEAFWRRSCDQWMINFRRQLAQTCQYEVLAGDGEGRDWSRYDFAFVFNTGEPQLARRPPVPVLMYGHDPWRGDVGRVVDQLRPEILLTPYPSLWRRLVDLPRSTRVLYYPLTAGTFFTRPCLTDADKTLDILILGIDSPNPIYRRRRVLKDKVRALQGEYRVGYRLAAGWERGGWVGPVDRGSRRYLNAWSRELGGARFAIFGPLADAARGMVLMKHFEALGSGAVPIIPDCPDLDLVGVKPWVHFIPVQEVEHDMDALRGVLDDYPRWRYIARNAAFWHADNADRLLFDGFEDAVQSVTRGRYPRRLVNDG